MCETTKLDELVKRREMELGRGEVISRIDIQQVPGDFPIYSSSSTGDGEFGRYGKHMFDEELITWSVDGGGRPFYRPRHKFSVTNVCGFLRILKPERWDYRYVHALLEYQHGRLTFDWLLKAHPSVIRELYILDVRPLAEQRIIAAALHSIDDAIHKTEQIIAKLKQVKQGLLQDLLTRGLDNNGELRDLERHPEQFQDSPLGRIPKIWGVGAVTSLLADVDPAMRSGPFGSALLKHELVKEGVPLLGIDNVHVERFVADYIRFVTPQKCDELRRYLVRPRDVMITIMGTVGRCCVVPDDIGKALSSKHVWTLTFDENRYPASLACVQFNYAPWVLRHFARDEQGAVMGAIRSETLRSTIMPIPPPAEARAIAARLDEVSSRIRREERALAKHRLLKSGLAEDLLTGRVRTTSLGEVGL